MFELLARGELECLATVFDDQKWIALLALWLRRRGPVGGCAIPAPGRRFDVHPVGKRRVSPVTAKFGSCFYEWHGVRYLTIEVSAGCNLKLENRVPSECNANR